MVDAPLLEAVFCFFKSIWSGEEKEVGNRVEGEGDRMDLIKMHYMPIGNSQTIKREHRLNKRIFFLTENRNFLSSTNEKGTISLIAELICV